MHYIRSYLRPISQTNIGLESDVELLAEDVETVKSRSECIKFEQIDEVEVWDYNDHNAHDMVRKPMKVENPERHWWLQTDGFLDDLEPSLQSHADILDLILAVNLCIDDPVAFSQSPGQTVRGAYKPRKEALDYRSDLPPGDLLLPLLHNNEIPREVEVSASVEQVYDWVRDIRAKPPDSDEDMDIRIALHMYDDGLTSSLFTAESNFFFACEKVLCSDYSENNTSRIANETELSVEEANKWEDAVNRLKHPDKGDTIEGLLQQKDMEVPTLRRMRKAANTALLSTMRSRFQE